MDNGANTYAYRKRRDGIVESDTERWRARDNKLHYETVNCGKDLALVSTGTVHHTGVKRCLSKGGTVFAERGALSVRPTSLDIKWGDAARAACNRWGVHKTDSVSSFWCSKSSPTQGLRNKERRHAAVCCPLLSPSSDLNKTKRCQLLRLSVLLL